MTRTMDKLNEWVVLVVDDSQVFRSILDVYLRDMVGTLLGAEDGIDALEVLNTRHVNLVITDLSMPRMDGALLVREIRMHPQRHIRTLPVILMTAEKDARILEEAGAV